MIITNLNLNYFKIVLFIKHTIFNITQVLFFEYSINFKFSFILYIIDSIIHNIIIYLCPKFNIYSIAVKIFNIPYYNTTVKLPLTVTSM